ncbi:hypothetical protein CF319_g4040 [Tilletia indica]|nr:hypothetical protein CF319_g4040 [Tilletia indica]
MVIFTLPLLISLLSLSAARASPSRRAFDDSTDYTPNITSLHTLTDTISSSLRASWEQGTAAAAFLELWDGQWSVFAGDKQGPPYRPDHVDINRASTPYKILSMGLRSIATQDSIGRLSTRVTGDEATNAGSALDSASSGESVLVGAFVEGQINPADGSTRVGASWIAPAARQLAFLLNTVPKAANGAISHRFPEVQIWSDGVYMGPPFYAQYGLMTRNQSLLQLAYDQCRLYRDILRITQGTSTGLWAHIWAATGTTTSNSTSSFRWIDSNSWITGNGWASAGMLRVAATIAQSPYASSMSGQIRDLTDWTAEILEAAFPLADPASGLFHNYANDTSQFLDSAGSSLLAYSAFRLASMGVLSPTQSESFLKPAERIYQSVQSGVGPLGDMTNGLDVVNVLSFSSDSAHSSTESLAFILLLSAARRDYGAGNVTGLGGPGTSTSGKHGRLSALGGGSDSSSSSKSSSAIGPIVGALLGGLVAGILATLLAIYCLRRRRRNYGRMESDKKTQQRKSWDLRRNSAGAGSAKKDRLHGSSQSAFAAAGAMPADEKPGGAAVVIGRDGNGISSSSSSDSNSPSARAAAAAALAAGRYGDEDDYYESPKTAVEENDNEKYSFWNNLTGRSPSLHRGVSFKEGTKAQGGHRRKNTASSSGGGSGKWRVSGGMLSRAGSERRREAVRAQDEAMFDDDEMTVQEHGGGGVGYVREQRERANAEMATVMPGSGGGVVPLVNMPSQAQAQAVPMDRTASSGSGSARRKASINGGRMVTPPTPAPPAHLHNAMGVTQRFADGASSAQPSQQQGQGQKTLDYFATPGAADPNRTPSGSDVGTVPDRPPRHARKPSSRAKALRSNRALIDGSAEDEDAGLGVGAVLGSYSESARRAEEGAALKGRGRHQRSMSNVSGASGSAARASGGHGRYASDAGPLAPGGGAGVPSPGRKNRADEARALRAFLAAAEEEEGRVRRAEEEGVAELARVASGSGRTNSAAHHHQHQQLSSRTRSTGEGGRPVTSEERRVYDVVGPLSVTTIHRTGSEGAGGARNHSIRRVQPPTDAGGAFNSVGDVLAAGVQYPAVADRGVRTASTRTRVPAASGGGARGRVSSGSGAAGGAARPGFL